MCCHGLFEIGAADVALIADGLRELDARTREELVTRAETALDAGMQPHLRDCAEDEKEAFFDRTDAMPCPALDSEGSCLIYEHRPIVCRTFGLPLQEGATYLGQECELNFTGASRAEKKGAAWNLEWEDILGPEDEYTVPEAIVLGALFLTK